MDIQLMRERSAFTRSVRDFFLERSYLEVETPLLAPALIPEPALEVFRTDWIDPRTLSERPLYLVPSPELWMKRLLARGSGSIFQICKSFRNGEALGRHHNPEFTMLEWYTVGAGYMDSADLTDDLLETLARLRAVTRRPSLEPPCARLSMSEAFERHAGVDLGRRSDRAGLLEAARRLGENPAADESWEQLFSRIFVSAVEPRLPAERPLILYDWPAAVPTTARSRGSVAERWELYSGGVEVANCYTEENDRQRLEALFAAEARRKRQRCRVIPPVDEELPALFAAGSPECSGVALGMDRLFMLHCGLHNIDGVIPYSFSDFSLEDNR